MVVHAPFLPGAKQTGHRTVRLVVVVVLVVVGLLGGHDLKGQSELSFA